MFDRVKKNGWLGALAVLVASSGTAGAGVTTYFGEDLQPNPNTPVVIAHPKADAANASFLSHLSGVSTETFEEFAAGTSTPLVTHFGADTATLTGSGTGGSGGMIETNNSTAPGGSTELQDGRFAISGTKYLRTSQNLTLTFSTAQAAFGFYGTDIADVGGQLTLTLVNGTTRTVQMIPDATGSTANGSVLFYGVIAQTAADQFTSITFNHTGSSNDDFGFDDFTIGRMSQVVATPEPATLVSAGLAGLFGIGYDLRRRRRTRATA